MSQIFILDPEFNRMAGHFASANRSLIKKLGQPAILYISNSLDDEILLENTRVVRHFSISPREIWKKEEDNKKVWRGILDGRKPANRLRRMLHAAKLSWNQKPEAGGQLFRDFKKIFRREAIGPTDHVIIHTGDQNVIRAIVAVMKIIPVTSRPGLHIRILDGKHVRRSDNVPYVELDKLIDQSPIYLYTEIRYLARWLKPWFPRRVFDLLRLPLYPCAPVNSLERATSSAKFRILFFGTIRNTKGWRRLAPILETLKNLAPNEANKWELVMHLSNTELINHRSSVDDIARIRDAGIQIRSEYLDDNQTSELFSSAQLVILPYCPYAAGLVGSGVALDAIAHGIPLLVTANCALEEFVESGNGLSADSDLDFAHAIFRIAKDYRTFASQAQRLADEATSWWEASRLKERIVMQ